MGHTRQYPLGVGQIQQAIMFKLYLSLFLTYVLSVSCGSSSTLKGKWLAESRECLLKDKAGRFKDSFGETKKNHSLHFMENNQVQLIYSDFDVAVKEGDEESETQTCDVVITGEYSSSLFGGTLYFDFKDDETGKWQISRGQNCDLSQDDQLPNKMPEGSPYVQDPSVSLIKVNPEELRLGFPNQTKCQEEKLIFIYHPQSG